MTYTYKLARRLAISRNLAMLYVLVLVAACAGETTAPEAPATPTTPAAPNGPVGFRVLPGTVTIEIDQRIRFRGEMRTLWGWVSTPLSWEASGGSIDSLGNFSADTPGTYRVVARGLGRGRAHPQRPDTSVVLVVRRRPGLTGITVTPRSPRLSVNESRAFTAVGRLANGTSAAIGVNWTATGGTIDPAGVYQAGSTAGQFLVIATNTNGTVADTVRVTVIAAESPDTIPAPTPNPIPDPTPALARVVLRPATVVLATAATHQFAAFGRNSVGDSIAIDVAFRATGGTITSTGLYTAGQTAGTYRVIATASELADTAVVTLAQTSGGGTPLPDPTPVPGSGTGIPMGLSGLLNSGRNPSPYTMSLDGYSAGGILGMLADARSRKIRVLMNMTGGMHNNYKTDGVFDLAKWRAKMDSYNTPAIRAAVAAAVADGTIVGNSVMDEPHQSDANTNFPEKSWGPEGWMTKAKVDGLCGYVKQIFPTLPTGVNHDHRHFEPEKNYAVCDYLGTQYRASKGPVAAWRDGALAFARRSGVQVMFSINLLHGGAKRSDCTAPCDMTPAEVRVFGLALGPNGCALNMWRYEQAYFDKPEVQSALRVIAESLATLPRRTCTRS